MTSGRPDSLPAAPQHRTRSRRRFPTPARVAARDATGDRPSAVWRTGCHARRRRCRTSDPDRPSGPPLRRLRCSRRNDRGDQWFGLLVCAKGSSDPTLTRDVGSGAPVWGDQASRIQPERVEPPVGIEPTTARLQGECSTTELRRHACVSISGALSAASPGRGRRRSTRSNRAASWWRRAARSTGSTSARSPRCSTSRQKSVPCCSTREPER